MSSQAPVEDTTATAMVRAAMFAWPYGEDGLVGTPAHLEEVLPASSNPAARRQVVLAYWQLAVAVADYHYATDELQWLKALPQPRASVEQAELRAAIESAGARFRETRLAVFNRQHELVQASPILTASDLILPLDAPFIGRYQTHFAAYAQVRNLPTRLAKIDQALPLMLDLILSRADAVQANQWHMLSARENYTQGQASLHPVLAGFLETRNQRMALLGIVRDYNHLIAEYAFAVGPQEASREAVVAMLIATDEGSGQQVAARTSNSVSRDPAVRRASATEASPPQNNWSRSYPR